MHESVVCDLAFCSFHVLNIFRFGTSVSLGTLIKYVLQSANTEFELQQVRCDWIGPI